MTDERGFTIIEVLVAAMILVVGLLATLSLTDGANQATTATKAREAGVNLQREVVELARSVPYNELVPGRVVAEIRERGLNDSTMGGGWRVTRRGVTYTISVGVCSVDDPTDRQGVKIAGRFCTTGSGQTSSAQCAAILSPGGTGGSNPDCGTDPNGDGEVDGLVATAQSCPAGGCTASNRDLTPDDYKRIITLVRWDRGQGSRWAIQTSTVPNPGYSAGPRVVTMTNQDSVYSGSGTTQAFDITTSRPPSKALLFVDGVQVDECSGTPLTSTTWACSWDFGSLASGKTPDGTYIVTAKALDEYNTAGSSFSTAFRLNRRLPPAVEGVVAGENALHGVVEVAWQASKDGDIERYEAYRVAGATETLVCDTTSKTTCSFAGTLSAQTTYSVRAWDTDNAGLARRSTANPPGSFNARAVNPPPESISGLVATSSNGVNILSWSAPAQGGTRPAVDFYRIYRRPAATSPLTVPPIAWRHDVTGSGLETSFVDTDPDGQQWDYWVTAVGTELAESVPVRVRR